VAWRGGALRRAFTIGGVFGICLGAMAWIDSGLLLAGVIVLVIVSPFYGIWMHRRMTRFWPGAADLTSDERVTVVRAARRGEPVGDTRLSQAVIDYARGMHAAAETAWPFRWLVPLVLVVAVATAVWDGVFGTWGNAVASTIYLVALLLELFWWPKHRDRLLANADASAGIAEDVLRQD
jgi:hypothetical protein